MSVTQVRERYSPVPVAVNTAVTITSNSTGGFMCSTSGTITLVSAAADGKVQTTLLVLAVTAGVYYPLPFYIGKEGGTFTTSGGAAGLLGV